MATNRNAAVSGSAIRVACPAKTWFCRVSKMAEQAGFEPAVGINPHTLSRRAT